MHTIYFINKYMKHIIKTIVLSGLLATTVPTVRPAEPSQRFMSLNELYSLADSRSKTIKIYEAAVEGAEKDISVAKNAYLPNIDLTASATYNGNAWVADRDFSNGQTFTSPHFGNSYAIEASQVVFAGGGIHFNVKALELQKKIDEWNLTAHRQEIYFLLTGYYLDLYKYRNLLTVYDRNISQTLQVIRDMKAREAAGVALDNDITRYEVQYQNLQYKRTELLSSIDICNDKIVTMLDLDAQTEILPDTTLLHKRMPKPEESEFQTQAADHSPLLNMNRLTLEMLNKKSNVAKAGYLPQISLIAGDNLKGPITYEIPTLNNNINTWYVGIGLKFSIGNFYKTPKELSRIRTSITQSEMELTSAHENVSLDVRAAYIRYLDSFELLKTQEKSLQLAKENYDVIANRYANDLVLVTDLVDADNLRLSAEVQYVNAQINVIYNYYKLLYASGTLNPSNLNSNEQEN